MYSVKGDMVLDPFCGLGTTTLACMASERSSIGVDISPEIIQLAEETISGQSRSLNSVIDNRLASHAAFIDSLREDQLQKCYQNIPHGFWVKTRQETALQIKGISQINHKGGHFICHYSDIPNTSKQ